MFVFAVIACLFAFSGGQQPSQNCLNCICRIEGCQGQVGKCRWDVYSLSCGPFQIKKEYWIDCGRPGGDYQTCTKQMDCSVTCVNAYMRRYASRCTRGRPPTCQDFARIHNGGPNGCRSSSTLGYWAKVQRCCSGVGGCGLESEGQLQYESQVKDVFDQFLEAEYGDDGQEKILQAE